MFSTEYPIDGDSTCEKRTRSRHLRKHVAVVIALCFAASSLAACGGSGSASSTSDPSLENQNNYTSQYETEWRQLFNSKHYSGYIAVKFKDDTEMRLRAGSLVSSKSIDGERAKPVREVMVRHGAQVERMLPMAEEKIERARARAKREGRKLHDWNLYYKIKVKSPGHAEELFKELRDLDSVEYIQPMPIPYVADVDDIPGDGTPGSLTEQLYFDTHAATGGLNVYAAWDQGIYGQGVRVSDAEYNWNFDHEDLGITEDDIIAEANIYPDGFDVNDPLYVNHGTAVAGVVRGIDNDTGVDGIAPQSDLGFFRVGVSPDGPMMYLMAKLEDYVSLDSETPPAQRPGDIILMEIQMPGPLTPPDTGCAVNMVTQEPTWCLPPEAYYYTFHGIQDITELGYIVVEGAGNGGVDLANPNARATACGSQECPDLSTDDAGAIMVAASNGQTDLNKPFWSNWGSRMNAYAWGYDVVSAGYGDHPMSDPADENKWYTTNFNGTSSAAALVAGAMTLVQSHVKDLYKGLYPHKQFYIDAYQMRDLITAVGHDGDPAYSIGKKPDVGAMMAMIADGDVLPHVVPDNPALTPRQQVIAGVRYDMDRDGRDELIVLDKGAWKVDRSDVAAGGPDPHPDNFGEWDLILNIPTPNSQNPNLFPVVSDYDSDGDADLAVYDNKNGIWYVKFTTHDLLNLPLDTEIDWDLEIDYSTDPLWKPFSRPVVGDFDGDLYLDLAIITGDGHFIIDYGGIGRIEKVGSDLVYISDFEGFENDVAFLTPEQLAEAPGWAYVASVYDNNGEGVYDLMFKAPVGEDEGFFFLSDPPEFTEINKLTWNVFGGNEYQIVPYNVVNGIAGELWLREVGGTGDWNVTSALTYYKVDISEPAWSDSDSCLPVPGDFNGDGLSEFAFMCSDEIRISYYDLQSGYPPVYTYLEDRTVDLDISPLALPPTVHPGGMPYDDIKAILEYYDLWDNYQDKDPFGPHTVQCIKYWAPPPTHCLAK